MLGNILRILIAECYIISFYKDSVVITPEVIEIERENDILLGKVRNILDSCVQNWNHHAK